MADTFFITTAIDYTNGAPHIGHAYEKVLADVLARYHRLKGEDVFFLTGVDQHGQKVQQSAEKQGVEPQQFVDEITAKFIALWKKLEVEYTGWAATTDPLHKECVRANLQRLWDDKDPATGQSRWLYKKSQRGFYSVRQEQFLTDKERGPDGEFGPEWQPVEERDEENFYFRLTQDPATGLPGFDPKQWLLDFIDWRSGKRGGQDFQDLQDSQDSASPQDTGNPVHPDNPANPVSKKRPFVLPEFRVAELRNAVEKLEGDLCISRPAARLQWGIAFPESFGAGFVTYVWFDALVNYISFVPGHDPHYAERQGGTRAPSALERVDRSDENGLGAPVPPSTFAAFWPPLHVIGKDILIPAHGVYWPVMLKALGFSDEEQPTLLVHGWWNIRGKGGESEKMSKSLGNVVDPDVLADKYGAEAVRYYLMADIATGKDADFSEERLIQRYNTDLANSLGNLLNRTLNMAAKYREGVLRRGDANADFGNPPLEATAEDELGEPLKFQKEGGSYASLKGFRLGVGRGTKRVYREAMDQYYVNYALAEVVARLLTYSNLLVEITAPWKLAKDPAQAERLDAVLYTLAESLRIIAILLSPVLPKAAHGIFDQLNWKMDEQGQESRFRLADATWGGLPDGHQLGQPTPLFPRIEVPKA